MRRTTLLALIMLLAASAPAGCGAQLKSTDPLAVQPPQGMEPAIYPPQGMEFMAPANWPRTVREAPGVFTVTSGEATITGFAYKRAEPLPRREQELDAARDRLVEEAQRREPSLTVATSGRREVDGAPAIELVGDQTLSKRRLRVHSIHVFRGEAEYVVEALAPPEAFDLVDREVLEPLLDSLELTGRIDP